MKRILLILALMPALSSVGFACGIRTEKLIFLDFNGSPNEVAEAKIGAEKNCQTFQLVESLEQAEQEFKKTETDGTKKVSLVLSGHSGSAGFSGTNFKMNREELVAFIDSHPLVKEKIRFMVAAGCYTNNIDKLLHWLKTFPAIESLYGYDLKSPLDEQLLGAEYMRNALIFDRQLKEKSTLSDIKDFIESNIVPGHPGMFQVSAAIYGKVPCLDGVANGEFYYVVRDKGTKTEITNMSGFMEKCGPEVQKYDSTYKVTLLGFWYGEKEMPEIAAPDSKDELVNPVRMKVYPWANQNAHCVANAFSTYNHENVNLGQILNLIFFQTIKRNFFKFFKSDAEAFTKTLNKAHDSVKELKRLMSIAPNLTRKETLSIPYYLRVLLNNQANYPELNAADWAVLKSFQHKLDKFLVKLDDHCADIDWIEEKDTFATPPADCLNP